MLSKRKEVEMQVKITSGKVMFVQLSDSFVSEVKCLPLTRWTYHLRHLEAQTLIIKKQQLDINYKIDPVQSLHNL